MRDRTVLYLVAINVLLRLALVVSLPLSYKEAYFWEWSHYLAAGYLEHPPLVAWVVALTSGGIGEGPVAAIWIRLGAFAFGLGTLFLIARLSRQLFEKRDVVVASLALALALPVLNAMGILMMPSGPLAFFHLLGFSLLVTALRSDGRPYHFYGAGVAFGFAVLSRFTVLPSIAAIIFVLLCSRQHRGLFRRKEPYIAVILGALVVTPFLIWNFGSGWATFKYQVSVIQADGVNFSFKNIAEFVGEQVANAALLILPLCACLFVRSSVLPEGWRFWYRCLRSQALATFACFFVVGSLSETHPQLTSLAYPPAVLALAALWHAAPSIWITSRLRGLLWVSQGILLLTMVFSLVAAPLLVGIDPENLPGSWHRGVVKGKVRLLGWEDLKRQIEPFLHDFNSKEAPLVFASGYQRSSLLEHQFGIGKVVNLSAYTRVAPDTGEAQRFFVPMDSLDGRSGVFVAHKDDLNLPWLKTLFTCVETLGEVTKTHFGQSLHTYKLFRVVGFDVAQVKSLRR